MDNAHGMLSIGYFRWIRSLGLSIEQVTCEFFFFFRQGNWKLLIRNLGSVKKASKKTFS